MNYTRVISDSDLDLFRRLRMLADDRRDGELTALVDRIISPPPEAPSAFRFDWRANPGHEVTVAKDERIDVRLVRLSGRLKERVVSTHPFEVSGPIRIKSYTSTIEVMTDEVKP